MPTNPQLTAKSIEHSALKTTLIYVIVAAGWIAFSDWLLGWTFNDRNLITKLATFKGWAFVAVTGGLLYVLIRRDLRRIQREVEARTATEMARQRWAAAFEHCAHGIALTEHGTNRLLVCNPAYARMLGYEAGELINVSIFAKYDEADRGKVERWIAEADRTGHVGYEVAVRRKGGSRFDAQVDVVSVRDGETALRYRVVTMQDVSERKKLEAQFLRAQRMEAIGMLAGGVAHDLNNILAPMLMAAGLLKESVTDPRDLEMLTMVEHSAQRGADIVRHLLTFSRGAGGVRAPTQVRFLMKEVSEILRETIPREIAFTMECALGLWPVVVDVTQLHQVLMNLCINARDAMPDGGQLTVRAENVTMAEGDTRLGPDAKPGTYVEFTVTDTGMGMTTETQARIFDPFFTTKDPGKGTGLGLPTVLGIVRGHGGFVTVASEPRCGSTFKVFLPARPGEEAKVPAGALESVSIGRGELILVVDDEEPIRSSFRQVLESYNYRVETAANGREAIAKFLEHRDSVQLVVTDLMMPEMGGAQLAHALRLLQSNLPLIATSGLHSDDGNVDTSRLGFSEILQKPCGPKALLEAIQRQLEAGRNREPVPTNAASRLPV